LSDSSKIKSVTIRWLAKPGNSSWMPYAPLGVIELDDDYDDDDYDY
jgi:hypothetical protein